MAQDIARALGTPEKHEGYLTVGSDTITWAYGHLVTLAAPEAYDPAWKTWAWTTLPMLPDKFQLQPIPKSADHLKQVLKLLRQADRIVCATDGDREGELIFRYIYALAQVRKPVDRLWLSENTASAIHKAFAAIRPLSTYDDLGAAAEARAQADWLVGLNATRAFTLRHGVPGQGALSVGRVQTPTLHLIVERDATIAHFQPMPYWQVMATFQAPVGEYTGRWQAPTGDHPDRIPTEAQAQALVHKCPPGTPGTIQSVEQKNVTVHAPLLFSLNDLQKEANRRFGLTAQQTLDAAQSLYEQHLTSYPRTDARHLTTDIAATVPDRVRGLGSAGSYQALVSQVPTPANPARLIDDKKVAQAGHHAIIPTGQAPAGTLTAPQTQIYDLIVRRFLSALCPDGTDARTRITTIAAGETFLTTGAAVVDPGWRTITKDLPSPGDSDAEPDDDSGPIPAGLQTGDAVKITQTAPDAKHTKPPAKITDASLLALMEKHGLGTPATRARILEVLLAREYVHRDKKALISTEKGQHLLQVVPASAQSPDLTGEWEARLEAIATGHENAADFLTGIREYTQKLIAQVQAQTPQIIGSASLGACPLCHHGVILSGKKGWGCSRWREGCAFTIWKTVAGKKLTEAQAKTLLSGQPTAVLKGFKSKAGKAFDARLKLDNGKVVFVFEKKKPPKHA